MAEIINLRRARKQRKRDEQDRQAAQNRVSFGRSKPERALAEAEQTLASRRLEGHRREPGDDEPR
ncbi:hypothetical protein ASG72_10315 [Bosea sp. Leaf344]|uniref:DUF4169 family protein n=1 Tax=Bosea sp. Leaf344 TaxID=1736346 RepID=UPI0006F44968|nr:DUF4169 family protein [Bosea sp. Leaf344]KQU51880.1 hypothetical protein ASG72_10315 [Bosea sp. Leaf344]